MKKIINLIFFTALFFVSCSENEIENTSPQPIESEFKKLASIDFDTPNGNRDSISETRISTSINSEGKPTEIFYGNSVNLLTVEVKDDLKNNPSITDYTFYGGVTKTHHFENGVYDIYYKFEDFKEDPNNIGSNSGKIILSTSGNDNDTESKVEISLTVFEKSQLEKLQTGERIEKINNFYFNGENTKGIGSVLFYLTYDPLENEETETEKVLKLPLLIEKEDNKLDFLKDSDYPELYNEYQDKLFLSKELLISATNENIYIFETRKNEAHAGYLLLRKYDIDLDDNKEKRFQIDMYRLTSIINASFVINDTYNETNQNNSYFVKGDSIATFNNFKNLYGINLRGMSCPYATIEGLPNTYYINRTTSNNTEGSCKLVLWAEGYNDIAFNNTIVDRSPIIGEVSMQANGNQVFEGYGVKGNSFAVVFKGSVLNNSKLCFYTVIDGKNILIYTTLFNLNLIQNSAHHITLLVKAQDLAKKLEDINKSSRANSNDFIEIEVPSENLIIN